MFLHHVRIHADLFGRKGQFLIVAVQLNTPTITDLIS
ncbi:hypothetical protein LCGC14_1788790, partial [marine sediment metagenome]